MNQYYIVDSKENGIPSPYDRGVIWRKSLDNENKIICKTFPYTQELIFEKHSDEIKDRFNTGDWKFYPSYEGTIIRIVNDPETGKQFIATHKKLDAFTSKWGSDKTFGELFSESIFEHYGEHSDIVDEKSENDVFTRFLKCLTVDKHHTFLLCSNLENRNVAHKDGDIYYVGSFNATTNEYLGILDANSSALVNSDSEDKLTDFCNIMTEVDFENEDLFEQLKKYVDYVNPLEQQGLIAIRQDKFEMFKMLNGAYVSLSELRNNHPNLKIRYLDLLKSKSYLLDDFCFFFGNKQYEFKEVKDLYLSIIHYLFSVINVRYNERRYVRVSPIIHSFVKRYEGKNVKDINFENIEEEVSKLPVGLLYNMINSFVSSVY